MKSSRLMAYVLAIALLATAACTGGAPATTPAPAAKAESPAAPKTGEAPKAETKSATKASEAGKSAIDAEAVSKYEALVQAAKKEGKITVSNTQSFVREPLEQNFGKEFDLQVDFLHLSGADLFNRLRTERQAGQYNLDVILTGGTTLFVNMMPEGMLDRMDDALILPEVTDPSKWLDGQIPWSDPEHRVLRLSKYVWNAISINTSIVKKGEITSFKDLLDPKWKGKIAAHDPTIPGAGANIGELLMLAYGEDFVKQLYLGQDVAFSRDDRQMGDWVGLGKYPILLWVNDRLLADMQKDGLPVEVVVTNDVAGVSGGFGTMGMLNKAPHPNAAKLFVNWFASKEGQETWTKVTGWPVTRVDVDQSSLPDYMKLKPGVKYVDTSDYDVVLRLTEVDKRIRELIPR